MIWSVSTLARSSGATRPFSTVNLSISSPLANVDEVPGDRGRRGHLRAHEVGPAAGALPALEIAVRSRAAALALCVTPPAPVDPCRVFLDRARAPLGHVRGGGAQRLDA